MDDAESNRGTAHSRARLIGKDAALYLGGEAHVWRAQTGRRAPQVVAAQADKNFRKPRRLPNREPTLRAQMGRKSTLPGAVV